MKYGQRRSGGVFSGSDDGPEQYYFRIAVIAIVGAVVLAGTAGMIAFFLSLRGTEQVSVPDVREMELVDSLITLQDKGLYPQVQVRFSSDPTLKGKIVSQQPRPGSLVKSGKRVSLVVSKGAVVDKVENFIGQNLNEVKIHLQTLFTTYKPLLRIKEPVTYVFDAEAEPGTIIEQNPEAGTELTGLTDLELVVSRGPAGKELRAGNFVGLPYPEAIQKLSRENVPFLFSLRETAAGEMPGIVVSQDPGSGQTMPENQPLHLVVTRPRSVPRGYVAGLFEYSLPDYPIAVDMRLESITPSGERREVFAMKHPGGNLAVPFVEPENSILVLSIFDREVIRHTVGPE